MNRCFLVKIHDRDGDGRPSPTILVVVAETEKMCVDKIILYMRVMGARCVYYKGRTPRVRIVGKRGYGYFENWDVDLKEISCLEVV